VSIWETQRPTLVPDRSPNAALEGVPLPPSMPSLLLLLLLLLVSALLSGASGAEVVGSVGGGGEEGLRERVATEPCMSLRLRMERCCCCCCCC